MLATLPHKKRYIPQPYHTTTLQWYHITQPYYHTTILTNAAKLKYHITISTHYFTTLPRYNNAQLLRYYCTSMLLLHNASLASLQCYFITRLPPGHASWPTSADVGFNFPDTCRIFAASSPTASDQIIRNPTRIKPSSGGCRIFHCKFSDIVGCK